MKALISLMRKDGLSLLIFLSVICIIGMVSCKKDEPEPTPSVNPTPQPQPQPVLQPQPQKPVQNSDSLWVESFRVIKPNLAKGIEDAYVEVTFNNPADVYAVTPELDGEDPHYLVDYKMSDDGMKVTIDMKYYHMCDRTFGFTISAKDRKSGRKWGNNIEFVNFNREYFYEGMVVNVITDYDNETIWMATKFPHRLYRITMSDPEHPVYKEFDLCPNVLTINPYNNKLYVGTTVTEYDQIPLYDRQVYVLDPTTLEKENSFTVSFDHTYQDPTSPLIWPDASPLSMAFTDDGYGIIVRQIYGDNGTNLCYVDSRNGNEITIDDCWTEYYASVDATYNKKQLIIKRDRFVGSDLFFVSRSNPTPQLFHIDSNYNTGDLGVGGTVSSCQFHRDKPWYLVHTTSDMCLVDYEANTYSPVHSMVGWADYVAFDYSNEKTAFKIDTFNGAYYYVDLNTGEALMGCLYVMPGAPGDIARNIIYNPKRDEFLFMQIPRDRSSNTIMIVFDTKEFRGNTIE